MPAWYTDGIRRSAVVVSRWVPALEASAFAVYGLWSGCFTVLLFDLGRSLGLSPGPLGAALFAAAGASIASMVALGWTAERLGRKAFVVASACAFGLGTAGLALVGSYAALVAALVVASSGGGLYNIGINAVAVDLEQSTGRRIMSFLHAAYAGGAAAGALGAGALLWAGVGYRLVYLSLLLPLVAVSAAHVAVRLPLPGGAAPVEAPAEKAARAGRWDLYRSAPLLLVAAIALLGFLAERGLGNWVGVYLRDAVGVGALVGGSGVAVFYGALAIGRLGTGWAVGGLGNRRTLMGAGLVAALGTALALATTLPALVVGGFVLVGAALSAVAPLAFSVAGDLAPKRAGAAISVVTSFAYGGSMLSPALVGGLAELAGLRVALGITVIAAGLAVVALAWGLRGDRRA